MRQGIHVNTQETEFRIEKGCESSVDQRYEVTSYIPGIGITCRSILSCWFAVGELRIFPA
ncbi:hypothetical cytosolic protein [Syntrophus aciditrophicus SB]|uniref:Hypothetical cytosolic protein n=1 Tax=Syntrophus aciditrophicus (strain SB) TaxID=56780 RepID=Q2LQ84_SYNAS|nr:hypothetical cytosolic protein [Syntrophus aciditrophicus SB]